MRIKCAFSGSGGQGSALMAKLVCDSAVKEDLKVVMTQTYGIEQRGGDSTAYVIVSDNPIGNPLVENDADFSVALSPSIYEACLNGTVKGGTCFVNSSLITNIIKKEHVRQICIPVSELAMELGSIKCANIIMLGAMIKAIKAISLETIRGELTISLGVKKPALLQMNLQALSKGFELDQNPME